MATTKTAPKTRITDTFMISTNGGETFKVVEHTKYETSKVAGVAREKIGRAFLKTEDGRGVIRNPDDNTYSIPSLEIKSAKRVAQEQAT